MTTRYFGAPIKRNEDPRLLRGRGLFVDDIGFPDMLHAAFLRSQVAHARIRRIDVAAARERAGVVAVYVAADLGDYWQPGPLLVPPPPIPGITFNQRTQVPLAKEKVRHVGEPLAVVTRRTSRPSGSTRRSTPSAGAPRSRWAMPARRSKRSHSTHPTGATPI